MSSASDARREHSRQFKLNKPQFRYSGFLAVESYCCSVLNSSYRPSQAASTPPGWIAVAKTSPPHPLLRGSFAQRAIKASWL
jgi:hypothetical protein